MKLQTASTTFGSPPLQLSQTTNGHSLAQVQKKGKQGPCTTTTTMITVRGKRVKRLLQVCDHMCDNDHYHVEEEERLTTTIGEMMAQGEGSHNDTTTRRTAMTTVMNDRLQERSNDKRTTTSLRDIVRLLTDRLRLRLLVFFSHGSRARTMTTRRDPTNTRVEEVAAASAMALTTTAMFLQQQLHLQTVQIQNRPHQQTQTDYIHLHSL